MNWNVIHNHKDYESFWVEFGNVPNPDMLGRKFVFSKTDPVAVTDEEKKAIEGLGTEECPGADMIRTLVFTAIGS